MFFTYHNIYITRTAGNNYLPTFYKELNTQMWLEKVASSIKMDLIWWCSLISIYIPRPLFKLDAACLSHWRLLIKSDGWNLKFLWLSFGLIEFAAATTRNFCSGVLWFLSGICFCNGRLHSLIKLKGGRNELCKMVLLWLMFTRKWNYKDEDDKRNENRAAGL